MVSDKRNRHSHTPSLLLLTTLLFLEHVQKNMEKGLSPSAVSSEDWAELLRTGLEVEGDSTWVGTALLALPLSLCLYQFS